MDQNWYISEDMNGKQLGKFSSAENGRVTFLTHPVHSFTTVVVNKNNQSNSINNITSVKHTKELRMHDALLILQ